MAYGLNEAWADANDWSTIWLSYAARNPSHVTKHARHQNKTRKSMAAYRKLEPVCELTGHPKIQVHHCKPVSIWPEGAWEMDNLISLCKPAHFVVGHCNDGWTTYNPYVRELVMMAKPFFYVVKTVKAGGILDPARKEQQPGPPHDTIAMAHLSAVAFMTHALRHCEPVVVTEMLASFTEVFERAKCARNEALIGEY